MSFYLVIPAYHESKRLPYFLTTLLPCIAQSKLEIHLQIVDDGSSLEEQNIIQELYENHHKTFPFLLPPLLLPKNQGKGSAITKAWKQHRNEAHLAFVDADGSITPSEIIYLLTIIASHHSFASKSCFSSRIKMLGKTVTRSTFRHYIGRLYATIASNLLNIEAYDTQCGFKTIPLFAYQKISSELTVSGFGFDLDLLLALKKHHIAITEIPINWTHTPGSKVHLFRDSIRMFLTILSLRKKYQR